MRVEGIEQIPHDLWPAVDLPALPWTDRMTLVLTGFDRTFRFSDDGATVQLIPMDRPQLSVRTFPVSSPSMRVEVLSGDFPGLEVVGRQATYRGTDEEHAMLQRLLRGQAETGRAKPSRPQVYTLKVDNQPVGAILKTLEQKMGVQLEISADAGPRLHERVTFDVRDVTLDQLLDNTLTPAGLVFRHERDVIIISAVNACAGGEHASASRRHRFGHVGRLTRRACGRARFQF